MKKSSLLSLFYLWLSCSSVVIASIFYFNKSAVNAIIALKDFPVYLFLLFLFFVKKNVSVEISILKKYLPLFIFLLPSFFISDADGMVKFASIRQIISFFILVLFGASLGGSEYVANKSQKKLVVIILFVCFFGLFEYFTELWSSGFLTPFFESKSIAILASGYPFFFIEPLPIFLQNIFDGGEIVRLTSTFLDPINLGHTLVLFISMIIFTKKNEDISFHHRVFVLLLFTLCLFLTFSKGAWLQLILVILFFTKKISGLLKILCFALVALLIMILSVSHEGLALHLIGTAASFTSISLLGHGLGLVGNYAAMFGQQLDLGIGDSFLGLLLGQIGLIGFLIWIFTMRSIYLALPEKSVYRIILISQLLIATISENAFNFMSISALGITIGLEISKNSYVTSYKRIQKE